jgi:hypothetical protein
MITIWVKSGSTPHPRRTHRLRLDALETECGITKHYLRPVTTTQVKQGITPPMFCHACFKYRYRFLSRPKKQWRHQMANL